VTNTIDYIVSRFLRRRCNIVIDKKWRELEQRLSSAERIVDLGCGNHPHPRASVAVDAFLEPLQRAMGQDSRIDEPSIRRKGMDFVVADILQLPFPDKQFDFAYSHHVFEHLPDPKSACAEICRIAHAGAIITPSPFAEIAFGRPYHLWFVTSRGNRLIFIRKRSEENMPFGVPPIRKNSGSFRATKDTNPFDMLLSDSGWYKGLLPLTRLGRLIQHYWYGHTPVMETVFLWEKQFECTVIDSNGDIA
jgi:SAM-dependent methyltransferase